MLLFLNSVVKYIGSFKNIIQSKTLNYKKLWMCLSDNIR